MTRLTPCPYCRRHVSLTETDCPFCERAIDLSRVVPRQLPRERLSRAAAFTFSAGVVGVLTGACGGSTDDVDPTLTSGGATFGGNTSRGGSPVTSQGGSGGTDVDFAGGAPSVPQGGNTQFTMGGVYGAPLGGAPAAGGNPTSGGYTFGNSGGVYGAPIFTGGRPGSGGKPGTGGEADAGSAGWEGSVGGVYGAPVAGAPNDDDSNSNP